MPWVILSLLVFAWGLPQMKAFLNGLSNPQLPIPLLDHAIFRAPPVVAAPKSEEAVFVFNWLSATGTSLLLAGIISGLMLGIGPARLVTLFGRTLWRVRMSLMTIAAMLALGFTTRYGGLDATMGLAFASTGVLFPFFSPMLGWLGVALTGSDTSSNVLFGNLQQITAQQLGISPLLAAASNSSGGVMGKMIDAQSIVVASVATEQQGQEGVILRYVFFHSLALACLVGLLVLLQAYVFPGSFPTSRQPATVRAAAWRWRWCRRPRSRRSRCCRPSARRRSAASSRCARRTIRRRVPARRCPDPATATLKRLDAAHREGLHHRRAVLAQERDRHVARLRARVREQDVGLLAARPADAAFGESPFRGGRRHAEAVVRFVPRRIRPVLRALDDDGHGRD